MDLISEFAVVIQDMTNAARDRDELLEQAGPFDAMKCNDLSWRINTLWVRSQEIAQQLRDMAGIPIAGGR